MIAIEVGARGIIRSDTITGPPHPAHVPAELTLNVAHKRPGISTTGGIVRVTPAAKTYCDLVTAALRNTPAATPGRPPVALVTPAWWGSTVLTEVCHWLKHVQLRVHPIPDAAAAITSARDEGHQLHGLVAVVTARSTYTSVTLVDTTEIIPRVLPYPSLVHPEGGAALDRLLAAHLHAGVTAHNTSGPAPTLSADARTAFLQQCRNLRESLSTASVTTAIPKLPGCGTELRLVRSEFEELAAPYMDEVQTLITHAIEHAPQEVTGVLLNGGLANTPLLGQRISADHDLEVIVPQHPRTTSTTGAALLYEQLTASRTRKRGLWRKPRNPATRQYSAHDNSVYATLEQVNGQPQQHERVWIPPEHRPQPGMHLSHGHPLTPNEPLLHLVKP